MNDKLWSTLSHELRNPLTALSSTVQLLECMHPEVREFKYWPALSSDIDYILSLLEQFSNYTKASHLQKETFSFHALLEQISLSFAATTMQSLVQYTSRIDPSIQQITGDKTKLQEVFWNLLKNAYDASLPDKSIFLDARKCSETYVISISDTGCGISPEHMETLFEPFVTYKKHGTGLGLAICKEIVDSHGGGISVISTPHKGTTFTITLPVNL